MFSNSFRAEWIKLSRRPLVWILLTVFLLLTTLFLSFWFLIVALQEGLFDDGQSQVELLRAEQIEQIKRQVSFPGIFGAMLGQINGIGGILAIIIAGGSMGSEYGWGTLRAQLTHQPRRGVYLAAKCAAIMVLLALGCLIALAYGSVLALVYSNALGLPIQLTATDLAMLPVGIARALYVLLPYTLSSISFAILGRSTLAGVGGGLTFLAFDIGFGSVNVLGLSSDLVRTLINLLLQQNINTFVVLNSQSYGIDQSVLARSLDLNLLPSPWQAFIVIGVYSTSFYCSAQWLLLRHDVGGAG
jgi:ABC-type transport system involved in multi-copper enzyme maturation permease subunit